MFGVKFGSPRFSINWPEAVKILKGAGIALLGAALPFLADLVGAVDLQDNTLLGGALAAVIAAGFNALRKFVANNTETPQ